MMPKLVRNGSSALRSAWTARPRQLRQPLGARGADVVLPHAPRPSPRAPRGRARPAPAAPGRSPAAHRALQIAQPGPRRTAPSRAPAHQGASAAAPYSSIVPSQNDGMVMPAMLSSAHRVVRPARRAVAIRQPSGIASTPPAPAPAPSAPAVTPTRGRISSSTGRPVQTLVPRSPCSARPSQWPYCTSRDWSRPELRAHRGDLLRRAVGVGAQHDLHGVARDQPDHQEGQHRDAERHEQTARPARLAQRAEHLLADAGASRSAAQAAGRRSAGSPARRRGPR